MLPESQSFTGYPRSFCDITNGSLPFPDQTIFIISSFENGMTGLAEDSEEASLVNREATLSVSYTEEGVRGKGATDDAVTSGHPDNDYVEAEVPVVAQFHEDAISQAGTGLFHWLLLLVAGLGLAADNAELFVVAFLIPSAEEDLCMENTDKACLAGVTFSGMLVGAIVWGSLADRVGRRTGLLSALIFNSLFGIIAAFMPNYGLLLTTRFFSGLGAGGLMPVVFVYYCEFLGRKERGKRMSWLLAFWALGGLFVALMAWASIPRTGISLMEEKKQYFSSWRVFVVLCSLPSLAALICLIFLPESPRFLLEVGRDIEAMFVYQSVYKTNHLYDPTAQYQLTELELPSRRQLYGGFPPPPTRSVIADVFNGFEAFWHSVFHVFFPPHVKITGILLTVWLATAFGYYGISLWIPEYMELLRENYYNNRVRHVSEKTFQGQAFNSSIENILYSECLFRDIKFSAIRLNHVIFRNSSFETCSFTDIESSRTFFVESSFVQTTFFDTDFYTYRFRSCDFINSTFLSTKGGCELDLDFNFQLLDVFAEAMIGQAVIIPGSLVTSLLMDRLGRVKVIGLSMFVTSLCAIFIWFLSTQMHVIIFEAVFNLVFLSGWSALYLLTVEIYPTFLRAAAFGVLSGLSKVAAVLGIVIFRGMVGLSLAIPMLAGATVALVAGIASVKLPETKDILI